MGDSTEKEVKENPTGCSCMCCSTLEGWKFDDSAKNPACTLYHNVMEFHVRLLQ
jgi:hypothetical protein